MAQQTRSVRQSSSAQSPGAARGAARGTARGEDIPVARREVSLSPSRSPLQRLLSRVGLAGLLLMLTAAGMVAAFPGPLRRWLLPQPEGPVPGLAARPSADGRLLGHFPYAEAPAEALVTLAPGLEMQRDAAESVLAMQRAAAADGVQLSLLSAFRPIDLQKQIFFDVKSERNQNALERAQVSAPPGFSEHSTGYAVDLGDASAPQTNLSADFEQTRAFRWLQANAARYHFVLSFPPDNAQGVSYEPWHWRFEGTAEALQLFEPAQRLSRP
jgi:D-alanyl-D-alanine carboxypeptidase